MSEIPVSSTSSGLLDEVRRSVAASGFAFVQAPAMADLLGVDAGDVAAFSAFWSDLGEDRYMADGGRYRRRRHATFDVERGDSAHGGVHRRPHQPHYQGTDFNPLNGGVERWFEPMQEAATDHRVMRSVLETCRALFDALTPDVARPKSWFTEVHQFRIEASAGGVGQPTPEGAHRDGVDWVLVMLLARENIASGVTTISDLERRPLGSFTLTEPLDAAIVDDARVFHGVTAVTPLDPARPAYRDVLVVTFRAAA